MTSEVIALSTNESVLRNTIIITSSGGEDVSSISIAWSCNGKTGTANLGNFTFDEMEEAFKYLHERGKKGYVTVNIYPQTHELDDISKYLKKCEQLGADALIISDPGIFSIVKQEGIKTPVSISTQANTTNQP